MAIFDKYVIISLKWCKVEPQLNVNRNLNKLYIGYQPLWCDNFE